MAPTAPTLGDFIPIKQVSSHRYETALETEWCIGTVPNGGYVTSAFLCVARAHMTSTHAARSQPHPLNLHLEFLRRTSAGRAVFTVQDVKLGARISNLHITLAQKQEHNDKYADEVQGYVTVSNIATEEGLTLDTSYSIYPQPLPVNLSLLPPNTDPNYTLRPRDPFAEFRRAARNIQMYLVRPSRRPADRPMSIIDQWVRFAPGGTPNGRWTNDALGFIVDIFPQIVEGYVNPFVEETAMGVHSPAELEAFLKKSPGHAKYWYPTLVLNLDVKTLLPEEGVEWLFVRVRAKRINNGRFDLDIEVWDAEGKLVATSVHASLIVDAARNTTRRKKEKL